MDVAIEPVDDGPGSRDLNRILAVQQRDHRSIARRTVLYLERQRVPVKTKTQAPMAIDTTGTKRTWHHLIHGRLVAGGTSLSAPGRNAITALHSCRHRGNQFDRRAKRVKARHHAGQRRQPRVDIRATIFIAGHFLGCPPRLIVTRPGVDQRVPKCSEPQRRYRSPPAASLMAAL